MRLPTFDALKWKTVSSFFFAQSVKLDFCVKQSSEPQWLNRKHAP